MINVFTPIHRIENPIANVSAIEMIDCPAYDHIYERISLHSEPEYESVLSGVTERYSNRGPLEQSGVPEPSELSGSSKADNQSIPSNPNIQSQFHQSEYPRYYETCSPASELNNQSGSSEPYDQTCSSELVNQSGSSEPNDQTGSSTVYNLTEPHDQSGSSEAHSPCSSSDSHDHCSSSETHTHS